MLTHAELTEPARAAAQRLATRLHPIHAAQLEFAVRRTARLASQGASVATVAAGRLCLTADELLTHARESLVGSLVVELADFPEIAFGVADAALDALERWRGARARGHR